MADDRIPRSDETECGSGIDADSATVKNNLHDNLHEKLSLERKIADKEEVLGDNEVASEENNIAPPPPSAEADKSEDDIKERRAKKRRKLQRATTSEMVDQRVGLRGQKPVPTRISTSSVRSCSKMKPRCQQIEKEVSTWCSKAT
ncbi:hypothetical protein AXG93_3036s1050 [Marchantia polymorpha subsp. ruderalis]|uniref:Uncharacterized protein n=1 Tax=Marchantia polymorpha subsp. ruderalis TaxID=1480154 RepID=A0A176W7C7_MARPO|nr:hypothetical protein AXG93_3036s1050 [Marchantia polymorpha subsp. ruderalis]